MQEGKQEVTNVHYSEKSNKCIQSHEHATVLPSLAVNPYHAEQIKIPCPLLIFSQSDYFIQIVDINSHNSKQCRFRSVGFFPKPTDLDLHCLKRQCISGFSRTRFK